MLIAVLLAKAVPALGRDGGFLRPDLILGTYGVTMIFFLSGLSLPTSDLTQAMANVKLNGLIQLSIFAAWPLGIGVPLKYLLTKDAATTTAIPLISLAPALVDGLLILTTLPTTVNMCIMLTSAGGGNVASAICNAVLSNVAGIVWTPLLLVHLFGSTGTGVLPLPPPGRMVGKLCQKVLLPVMVGQVLRRSPIRSFYEEHSQAFKRSQEVILLGIVWNAFSNAFAAGSGLSMADSLVLLILLSSLHLLVLGACFRFFSLPTLGFGRPEQVAASFCASQKTLAFGLPLINTVFRGNTNLASYSAPIMFLHPLQMAIGSLLVPAIKRYATADSSRSPANAAATTAVPNASER
jgi:solute carrier family 10 (sodium/bile acid cotransporter), member 7